MSVDAGQLIDAYNSGAESQVDAILSNFFESGEADRESIYRDLLSRFDDMPLLLRAMVAGLTIPSAIFGFKFVFRALAELSELKADGVLDDPLHEAYCDIGYGAHVVREGRAVAISQLLADFNDVELLGLVHYLLWMRLTIRSKRDCVAFNAIVDATSSSPSEKIRCLAKDLKCLDV